MIGIGVGGLAGTEQAATTVPVQTSIAAGGDDDGRGTEIEPRNASVDALLMLERTRWAYEIHDGITQVVTAALLELEWLAGLVQGDPETASRSLEATGNELRRALVELRGIMFNLIHGSGPDGRPGSPLAAHAKDAARRWHLSLSLETGEETSDVPIGVFETACAVIAESVSNVAKHAGVGAVIVRTHTNDGALQIEIEDAGRGFDPAAPRSESNHFGLGMMQSRTEAIGGSLAIESSLGNGTRVVVRLPTGRGEAR